MSDPAFLLMHSPFLGPASWEPMRTELTARGRLAVVSDLVDGVIGPAPHIPAIARSVVRALDEVAIPVTLVAHSGAGPLVPAVVAAAPDSVAAVVFVDATLPYPGLSWFESAPRELGARLRALAHDGVLPPWHTWFGPDVLAALVSEPDARDRLCADIPRVPLSYVAETAPADHGWRRIPTCYLRLSEAYLDAGTVAHGAGWRTAVLPDAHHLSGYTDPRRVVDAVESLLASPPSSG